jgi:pyrroline-5-carboxylate reductase
MYPISIFGAGHLTESLVKGLSLISRQNITVYNRTYDNIIPLRKYYPNIIPISDIENFIIRQSYVFLIIPPSAIMNPPEEFKKQLRETDSVLVSCGYFNSVDMLNKVYTDTKIIRISPNINWQIAHGVTIYSKNNLVTDDELKNFLNFISSITDLVKANTEDDFDNLGKITACGPALYMNIIENMCDSFGICNHEQRDAVYKTIAGVFEYASQTGKKPSDIIAEVANKGGITESGITAINNYLPPAFTDVKEKMIARTEMVKASLSS